MFISPSDMNLGRHYLPMMEPCGKRDRIFILVGRCKKVIDIMRCLKGTGWGASTQALKQIYITMIRSVIEYGIIVYSAACRTQLHKLEVLQNQALRICAEAMRSTLAELPLNLR